MKARADVCTDLFQFLDVLVQLQVVENDGHEQADHNLQHTQHSDRRQPTWLPSSITLPLTKPIYLLFPYVYSYFYNCSYPLFLYFCSYFYNPFTYFIFIFLLLPLYVYLCITSIFPLLLLCIYLCIIYIFLLITMWNSNNTDPNKYIVINSRCMLFLAYRNWTHGTYSRTSPGGRLHKEIPA